MTRVVVLLLFCMIFLPAETFAQYHNKYCQNVDSTAATLECLKKHADSAQENLNSVFNALSENLEGENVEQLQDIQNAWIVYRDKECAWEASLADPEALGKASELSCIARLSDHRVEVLKTVLGEEESEGVREFSSTPRWKNALIKDNPDVYWKFEDVVVKDLNCDSEDDYIVSGMRLVEQDDKSGQYGFEIMVAISENPATGRPKAYNFAFPVMNPKEASAQKLCSSDFSLSFEDISEKSDDDNTEDVESLEEQQCHMRLKIDDTICSPHFIGWSGSAYAVVETEKNIEENLE